jgi:hypothetical protein
VANNRSVGSLKGLMRIWTTSLLHGPRLDIFSCRGLCRRITTQLELDYGIAPDFAA